MTATATAAPACPKCQGPVWDQLASKFWGNGLTKNGKQKPRWECKNKDCGGAVWDKSIPAVINPLPKAPVVYAANKPEPELPPLLRNAEAEDNAELAAKIGVDLSGIQKQLATYQAVAEWTVKTLPPIFGAGKDAVGMTPESLAACTNTIFINAAKK